MSCLFKHVRVHQIFGANTNVGKTILSTALVRASAQLGKNVFYLKPISTGPLDDADDLHIIRHTKEFRRLVHAECLFRYEEPVSPHLAVKVKGHVDVPTDETFVRAIANRLKVHAKETLGVSHVYLETAGGVHSPSLSGTTQADCYRPLFLPTILIGDSRLGGISSTISSYESLLLRGYIVDAVLLFHDDYYRNGEYLKPYFEEKGVYLSTVRHPPPKQANLSQNFELTQHYYDSTMVENGFDVKSVVEHLDHCHDRRIQELGSMPRRSLDTIWWPFVQHGLIDGEKDVTVIDSAHSDFFSVTNQSVVNNTSSKADILSPQFDGSASWWTQTLGHSHPSLTLAAARASGRYGHVMFPQATHLPALKLAERLVNGPGKGWASRVFFSDNGSTGMEVALKMALRSYSVRHWTRLTKDAKKDLGILGLRGSYHGDTIGAMDACEEGVYTCEWHNAKGFWFDCPTIGIKDGQVRINIPKSIGPQFQHAESLAWAYDVEKRLHTPLARAYTKYFTRTLDALKAQGQHFAALVLEPLVMGAGGMLFVDPLFQRTLVDVVRNWKSGDSDTWFGMPVIFDEVFVGLNRIGVQSSGPLLGVHPDISVFAKVLTGGLVPLAVTLTSKSIFEAFLSDSKADALLHGHSYTAHAVGCEVANETLAVIDKVTSSNDWISAKSKWAKPDGSETPVWSLWDPDFVKAISNLPQVKEVMTLGSILSIRIQDPKGGYTSRSAQDLLQPLGQLADSDDSITTPSGAPFGIHYRTLGDVAYFITSLNSSASIIRSVEDKIRQTLSCA